MSDTTPAPATPHAVFWTGVEVLARQGLQLVTMLVLARLLTPADFGTMAVGLVFSGLAGVLTEAGFSAALIQRPQPTPRDEASVFWFNLAMAAFVAGVLACAAEAIAAWFASPALAPLLRVTAGAIVIGSFGTVPSTLLTKRLENRRLAQIQVTTQGVAALVAIALAVEGAGVWALAAQLLVATALRTVLVWRACGWRPGAPFAWDSLRSMAGYGAYMAASGIVNTLHWHASSLVIGRVFSVADVGVYSRAQSVQAMPATLVASVVNRAAFPLFAAAAARGSGLADGLRRAHLLLAAVNLPCMLGLAALADRVVPLLLGPQWSAAVAILRLLCIAGAVYPHYLLNVSAAMALGRSDLLFFSEAIGRALSVAAIVVAGTHGVLAVAGVQIATSGGFFLLGALFAWRRVGYGWGQQAADLVGPAAAAMAMAALVYAMSTRLAWSDVAVVATGMALGAIAYVGLLAALGRGALRLGRDALGALRGRKSYA